MSEPDMQETCGSLSEWIAMVQLGSPRVSADDDVDPYLSRYVVPDAGQTRTTDLISLKWHGFISSKWIMQLFVALLWVPKFHFYQCMVETDTCPKWATAGAIRQSLRPRLHGLFYPLQRWESKP